MFLTWMDERLHESTIVLTSRPRMTLHLYANKMLQAWIIDYSKTKIVQQTKLM